MKTIIFQYKHIMSKGFFSPSILALFLFMSIGYSGFSQGQTAPACGVANSSMPSMPYPDCDRELSWKTVRIKVHYVNHTNPPSLSEISEELRILNEKYEPAKIRFVFDYNCPNYATMDWQGMRKALFDQNGNWHPNPILEVDANSINVFNVDEGSTGRWGNAYFNPATGVAHPATESNLNDPHEIGHSLTLRHTFIGDNNGAPWPKDEWETKTRGAGTNCHLVADRLCDTGADPYSMDLDGDNVIDQYMWAIDCAQSPSLVPSIADGVGDVTTPWNIPSDNIMSYYVCEDDKFTPCQIAQMHEFLEQHGQNFLVSTCDDIIVSTNETWKDGELLLCPYQKIIIKPNASLTLDNFMLTIDPSYPNNTCQPYNLWDGIYIEGGHNAFTYPSGPGGGGPQSVPATGFVRVLNNSLIEKAENGIVALQNFGFIEIDHSIIKQCGRAVKAVQDLTLSGENDACDYFSGTQRGTVSISNHSQIIVENPSANSFSYLKNAQIKLVGTPILMQRCTLQALNSSHPIIPIIAVNSTGAECKITDQTIIRDCSTGIYTDVSGLWGCGAGTGLKIDNSRILNCSDAITNRGPFVRAVSNIIRGEVTSEGLMFGLWELNNIGSDDEEDPKDFVLTNPEMSNMIRNNLFKEDFTEFREDNKLSLAECNVWASQLYVDQITATGDMPPSWGTINEASGNSWSGNKYTMNKTSSGQIFNYEPKDPDPLPDQGFHFNYAGEFKARFTDHPHPDCPHGWPELTGGGTDGSTSNPYDAIDFQDLDNQWLAYQQTINQLESEISSSTDDSTIQVLNQALVYNQAYQNSITGLALSELTANDDASLQNLWLSRAPDKMLIRQEIMQYFDPDHFQQLSDVLTGLSVPSDEADDFGILQYSVNNMLQWQNDGVDLKKLPQSKLEQIIELAGSSSGDYTAVLRGFLNAYYDIQVQLDPNQLYESKQKVRRAGSLPRLKIVPNPTSRCFTLSGSVADGKQRLNVNVLDVRGRSVYSATKYATDEICLPQDLSPALYLLIYRSEETGDEGHLKLVLH